MTTNPFADSLERTPRKIARQGDQQEELPKSDVSQVHQLPDS